MSPGFLIVCVFAVWLGGCASTAPTPVGLARTPDQPVGYLYYDGFHPNWVNNPSPEAIANAQRGTYLWPPADLRR